MVSAQVSSMWIQTVQCIDVAKFASKVKFSPAVFNVTLSSCLRYLAYSTGLKSRTFTEVKWVAQV